MRKSFLLLVFVYWAGLLPAQDCTLYFPSDEGKELTYSWFSKPGKVESSSKIKILKKEYNGTNLKIDVAAESFDAKGKSTLAFNYSVWCDGTNFYLDMRSALGSMNLTELQGFKIETTDMEFPASLSPGQALKDASIRLSMEGPVPINMNTNITNRKVESFEKVTTPAGTFDCFKISYDSFSKFSIVKSELRTVEWYAPDIGLVRSESYNKKNKLTGINELTQMN